MSSKVILIPRVGFSLATALLTGTIAGTIVFGPDIAAVTEARSMEANRRLFVTTTALTDSQIQRSSNSFATQTARVSALSAQVTKLTQNSLDPTLNDPAVQQVQSELAALTEQKSKTEESIRAAEMFAANETSGTKGAPGNTGKPGQGARYKAAIQQVAEGKARLQELDRRLTAAQSKLADARERASAAGEATMQRSREQLPSLELSLKTETAELDRLKAELAKAIGDRETTIRKAVEAAPDYVKPETGLIAQLTILGKLAESDRKIAAIIALIDLLSFALEAAALLSKMLVRIPSSYAARVARDAHLRITAIANDLKPGNDGSPAPAPEPPPAPRPSGMAASAPFNGVQLETIPPLKRGRGRPRKYPLTPQPLGPTAQ